MYLFLYAVIRLHIRIHVVALAVARGPVDDRSVRPGPHGGEEAARDVERGELVRVEVAEEIGYVGDGRDMVAVGEGERRYDAVCRFRDDTCGPYIGSEPVGGAGERYPYGGGIACHFTCPQVYCRRYAFQAGFNGGDTLRVALRDGEGEVYPAHPLVHGQRDPYGVVGNRVGGCRTGKEDACIGDEQGGRCIVCCSICRSVRHCVYRGDTVVHADACREVIGEHFHGARLEKSGYDECRTVCRGGVAGCFYTVLGRDCHVFAALRPFRGACYGTFVGVRGLVAVFLVATGGKEQD